MIRLNILIITAVLLSMAFAVFPSQIKAQSIPKYSVFELTLTASGSYSNPYLQMPGDNVTPGFVVGTFTAPSGKVIKIDGFWDGAKAWKIRMAPTETGSWSYKTTSSDSGLNNKTGTFTATSSSSKGFIRVDPVNKNHFIYDDGTPFYWAGDSETVANYSDPVNKQRSLNDNSFDSWLNARALQGFSAMHWGYYGFNKTQFKDKTQQNEGGPPFTSYNPDLLNPSYHQYGDIRLKKYTDKGYIVEFTLGWPDQNIGSFGHIRLKRYFRYLIARYAAYNVKWNLFGEGNEWGSNYMTILNDYGNLVKTWDPYKHLTTTHLTDGPSATLANQTWLDYIKLQLPTTQTQNYLSYNKPVENAEYDGYEDFQVTGEQLRPLVWDIKMRGGYFVYETWGSDVNSTGAKYSSYANLFFKNKTQFWKLKYHPELFNSNPGVADPGNEYAYYVKAGASASVNLSGTTNTFTVEWFNPRLNQSQNAGTVNGGAQRSFTPPDSKDWVLHLVKTTSATSTPTFTLTPTLSTKPGDANGDGKVDSADYTIWRSHYNITTTGGISHGDFNTNGKVEGIDYVIWLINFGT